MWINQRKVFNGSDSEPAEFDGEWACDKCQSTDLDETVNVCDGCQVEASQADLDRKAALIVADGIEDYITVEQQYQMNTLLAGLLKLQPTTGNAETLKVALAELMNELLTEIMQDE